MIRTAKTMIFFAIASISVFAHAQQLNLLKINPLEWQKLLNCADNNWMLPAFPSESEYTGVGQPLMTSGGYLIHSEAFKKEEHPEPLRPIRQRKFSIGISYSPGIAYAGMLARSLATGEMDPFHKLYWNNLIEVNCSYYFDSHWALELGGGYMWTHLDERSSYLRPPELWALGNSNEWNISNLSGKFALLYILREITFTGGLEYYNASGKDYEQWLKGDTIRIFTGRVFSKGPGCFISAGFDKSLFGNVSWHTHLVLRYGTANSYNKEVEQEDVIWRKDIYFSFTGIYVKIGINYNFFKGGG